MGASVIFEDRRHAGAKLAAALQRFKGRDPVVLALPRGGVSVGFEIAQALEAPLDLVLVRKIGAPYEPELAVAAVVDGEKTELVVNQDVVDALGLSETYLQTEAARQVEEIERRRRLYLAGRGRVEVAGRTALVVDDGIATGATMRAALRAVRARRPERLVLAVPVAPPETVERLRPEVDEVVCLSTPSPFGAIGQFYADFRQVGDDEVRELLARVARRGTSAAPTGASAHGIEAKVAFLRRPEAYPEKPRAVEAVETHMSWVFLTERHAYKLKKPVHYDGLDFRTPELRRLDCEEELRLNRRLAEDVYLGIVPLTVDRDGTLELEGAGEPIDWLVHMRRLPAERMLDGLIRRARIEEAEVRPAALRLAHFYARARPVEITGPAYRGRLEEGVREDERELREPRYGLARDRVTALARAQLAFLERHPALFDVRAREGRIVEGHGDLRPEHICLTRTPAIIDCLEFSRELRILDPADELAFLALECERLGAAVVGRWFLDSYSRVTGDEPPEALLRFHRTYRALRRAKIAVWHLRDPDVRDPGRWSERARRYLELAARVA
jgi:predicted phosphoribosyltransferase/aminoglycoside phosphotransferase family enzyme